jgi:4-amino-4-deoxy-L-arabinose transferase-like glycosyltransferase
MRPFRFFTFAVFAAATVPRLVHRGMFVDGVTYASIARNLAEGQGSFWSPFYTSTIYPQFHEHPPLGFWLQSLWFRLLGDHLFVERAYSIVAGLATAVVMAWIWRRLAVNRPDDLSGWEWLPILFWIGVPVVSWSIVGNLLETSVAVFTATAVAAAIAAANVERMTAAAGWGILSGAAIVAATLTKGPAGLFPLAAPIIFWPISGRRRAWASLGGQWATAVLCAVALWSVTAARASLTQWVDQQVLPALSGQREVSASSLTIVTQLIQAVLAPILVAGAFTAATRRGGVVAPAGTGGHAANRRERQAGGPLSGAGCAVLRARRRSRHRADARGRRRSNRRAPNCRGPGHCDYRAGHYWGCLHARCRT